MAHDGPEHWHEVTGTTNKAGLGSFKQPAMPYDAFMEAQEIPIHRAAGIHRVQDLPLKPWKRMGGRGSFIQLFGTEGLWGCYVVEVPGAGALNVERHTYEEQFLVIEGRGTTEIWNDGGEKLVFEWNAGSLFAIPLNTKHRIINASSSPALLLAGTSAPNVMNLFEDMNFIFNCDHQFPTRFDGSEDYFKPNDDIVPDPVRGLAARRSNLIPDIVNCELPLDNRRSLGYRRVEPEMANQRFWTFVGQHETGRYSKAHFHGSAAVLICLTGKGYTYTWPKELGMTPWKDGHGDKVVRVDYEPVGMVSAAPMSGDWFHQHFGVSKDPLRLIVFVGPNNGLTRKPRVPGEARKDIGSIDIRSGGNAIAHDQEDPFIRQEYEAAVAKNGAVSRMDPDFYIPGNKKAELWGSDKF
jgi:mannose-6-phosphate isomerase-like protein (cupin superfamily)